MFEGDWNVGTTVVTLVMLFGIFKFVEYFWKRRAARKAQQKSRLPGGGTKLPPQDPK